MLVGILEREGEKVLTRECGMASNFFGWRYRGVVVGHVRYDLRARMWIKRGKSRAVYGKLRWYRGELTSSKGFS